ncbi:MAG: VCBS repeat-containing protein, partial [Deltaproteobacteria bacterium]|nr:VCBS repeat-containing protein [Deltaproteobacteria bacterium]
NANARVYGQGVRNVNDALSYLSIADSALGDTSSIVQRLKELASQSANGTFSNQQRVALDEEARSLVLEFNRIVGSVQFNGRMVLQGSRETLAIQAGYGSGGTLQFGQTDALERNAGTAGFAAAGAVSMGGPIGESVLGDVNGDGILDIVGIAASGPALAVALGNGNGTFKSAVSTTIAAVGTHIRGGDFNGDGRFDVVVGQTDQLQVALGQGNGTFTVGATVGAVGLRALAVGDWSGDGRLDVAALRSSAQLSLYQGGGSNTIALSTTITVSGNASDVAFNDLNSDGKLDLIVANGVDSTVSTRLQISGANYAAAQTFATLTAANSLTLADYNNDGYSDIAISNSGGLSTLLGNGDGTLKAATSYAATGTSVRSGDINNDGITDLITDTGVLLGNRDGTFGAAIAHSAGTGGKIQVGDLDGDGVLDIIANVGNTTYRSLGLSQVTTQLQDINLRSRTNALSAMSILDDTLSRIGKERGLIGSYQSRLFSTLNTLSESRLNAEAAAGRITDADIASETAAMLRNTILQQAGAALLGQASQAPALALKLLRTG